MVDVEWRGGNEYNGAVGTSPEIEGSLESLAFPGASGYRIILLCCRVQDSDRQQPLQKLRPSGRSTPACCQHQEAVLDFYTDESLIFEDVPGYKNVVKKGSVYVPVVRSLLRAANKKGEKILDSTFRDVQFVQTGDNVRINATRHSNIKDFNSPFFIACGGGDGDGQLVILEERMEHVLDGPLEHVEITIEVEGDSEE